MDLVPYMYWERQEAGSQLCAQHCLNNILQQFTYTEFDLADVAQKLDQAENATLSAPNQNKKSYNLDDTGYFSISVLERALQVWDLTLVRWRGEAMKPYQAHPEDQAAFILHLSSHWLPLRRFSPMPATKGASKRWYNLNSFLPNGPEWISPTYLRMFLSQAEEEGYSVFVLRKGGNDHTEGMKKGEGEGWGDGGVGILPECEADRIAVVLGEPAGRGGGAGSPALPRTVGGAGPSRTPLASHNPDEPTVDTAAFPAAGPSSPPTEQDMSDRRRKRQEDLISAPDPTDPFVQAGPIKPTRPSAREVTSRNDLADATLPADDTDKSVYDDADEGIDDLGAARENDDGGPSDFSFHSRSYDDEDAALQAALNASMMDIPTGWVAPAIETKKPNKKTRGVAVAAPAPAAVQTSASQYAQDVRESRDVGSHRSLGAGADQSKFKEEIEDDNDAPTEVLSPDEIRKRRLAKFGQ